MEFIGISGRENEVDTKSIIRSAQDLGLEVVKNNWNYDINNSVGLKFFTDKVNDDFLIQLILRNKGGKQTTTSNFLTEELGDFYIHNGRSKFIEFIKCLAEEQLKLDRLHIIFANEWENTTQKIRYIKTDLKGVEDYFKSNNGWHLIFYSLNTYSYLYEFDCPLVFRIQF